MISWKHSFNRLNEENEMAKKKKQALDNLLNMGRISQSTYDVFSREMDEAIAEIERRENALLEKMNSKMIELEGQIKMLEMLLANFEIQHVTGEVEEDVYQREIGVLSIGIETARNELDAIKEAVNQLSGGPQISTSEVVAEQKVEPQAEVSQSQVEVVEKLPEPPVESLEVKKVESSQAQQESPKEKSETKEEAHLSETVAEGGEKQEA